MLQQFVITEGISRALCFDLGRTEPEFQIGSSARIIAVSGHSEWSANCLPPSPPVRCSGPGKNDPRPFRPDDEEPGEIAGIA